MQYSDWIDLLTSSKEHLGKKKPWNSVSWVTLSKGEAFWIIIYIVVNYMKYKTKPTKKEKLSHIFGFFLPKNAWFDYDWIRHWIVSVPTLQFV